jgi:hypothetical protein
MTMPEMIVQLIKDPWDTAKMLLSTLNPFGDNFILKVLGEEVWKQGKNIFVGTSYEKGRALTFTAMTVLPFIPK